MNFEFIMIPVLLIVIPLLTGLVAFLIKQEKSVKAWAMLSSVATLVVSIAGLTVFNKDSYLQTHIVWLAELGSSFSVNLDSLAQVLCLLTAIAFPVIFVATYNSKYKNAHNFYALMLLLYGLLLAGFFWKLMRWVIN